MTEHDYDEGYRAGMQKMRDLAQARIDELEAANDAAEKSNRISDNGNLWRFWSDKAREYTNKNVKLQARIDTLTEALRDMVDLFSADDMLLKGTHLHATLKQARAALEGTDK